MKKSQHIQVVKLKANDRVVKHTLTDLHTLSGQLLHWFLVPAPVMFATRYVGIHRLMRLIALHRRIAMQPLISPTLLVVIMCR